MLKTSRNKMRLGFIGLNLIHLNRNVLLLQKDIFHSSLQ